MGIPIDIIHFLSRAKDSGDWDTATQGIDCSKEQILALLNDKIDSVSFSSITEDVVRFIPDNRSLSIWSPSYFKDLVEKLKLDPRTN
jgi:hypothetical protein